MDRLQNNVDVDGSMPYVLCPICGKYRCNVYDDMSCENCVKKQIQEFGHRICNFDGNINEKYYCKCLENVDTYTIRLINYINMLKDQHEQIEIEYALLKKDYKLQINHHTDLEIKYRALLTKKLNITQGKVIKWK